MRKLTIPPYVRSKNFEKQLYDEALLIVYRKTYMKSLF